MCVSVFLYFPSSAHTVQYEGPGGQAHIPIALLLACLFTRAVRAPLQGLGPVGLFGPLPLLFTKGFSLVSPFRFTEQPELLEGVPCRT